MNDLNFKNDSSKKPFFKRKKTCPFSGPNAPIIDYKDIKLLSRYVTERGKIIPSRISSISTINPQLSEILFEVKVHKSLRYCWSSGKATNFK